MKIMIKSYSCSLMHIGRVVICGKYKCLIVPREVTASVFQSICWPDQREGRN